VGHPKTDNQTPFAFEPVFVSDENLRPVVVTVVKATYSLDETGILTLADEQVPVNLAGQKSGEEPDAPYKYEPEIALSKPGADVVLIGHARPAQAGETAIDVGVKVGPVQQIARVFGNRFWVRTATGVRMSRTEALQMVPLTWQHAFGGHDLIRSTPEHPLFESRNPVGTGFGQPGAKDGDFIRVPNIEDPKQLIRECGEVVTPVGFGFTSPHWQPRASFGGTFGEEWEQGRKPLLPVDFDRRFFNAAAPGLIGDRCLAGNEEVVVLNASPVPRLAFRLPSVAPPRCVVVLRKQKDITLATSLDTVIVNTDEGKLFLLWRACTPIANGAHDVSAFSVSLPS
jgi:hypothetical protein